MKSRTMKFTLDCSKVGNQLCIDGIRQGDANSIVFIISLANGINLLDVVAGKEESVVVTMYGKKPDGTTIVRDCGINEDGNITYTIHTQDTTCVGIVSYQLVVTSTSEKILAFPVFSTMVEERNLFKTYTVLTTQPEDWADGYDKYYYYEDGRFYKLNRFESESAPEWILNKYYSVNDNEVESTSDFDALSYALLRAKQYSDKSEEYLAEVKKKADKSTTLAGYGITDALRNAKGTVSTNNLADNCVSSNKLSADVRANINSKAESAKVSQQLSLKADASSVYTKSESDALLKAKANSADVDASVKTINTTIANNQKSVNASLESLNTVLTNKADTDVVNEVKQRAESNTTAIKLKVSRTDFNNTVTNLTNSINGKSDINSVYSKTETDNLLAEKADKVDVDTSVKTINTTIANNQKSVNASLESLNTVLTNKADTDVVNEVKQRAESNTTAIKLKVSRTDFNNTVTNLTNSINGKSDINSVYSKTETDNLLAEKADKVDVDTLLSNKANLVNSLNIFDFNSWAKGLQGLTNPVYKGTLDKVDYIEKSLTFTFTESWGHTNGWNPSTPESMRIAVKPNTKYLFSWLPSSTNCVAYVFLNGVNTDTTRFSLKSGFGSFTTAEDTTYILIRFDYNRVGFFKVSEIMIAEKESIYLPNKVAEGVPEVADEVFVFEKTTQTSLDGKYDSSNIESGTSTLTPYSTVVDKIKSASCTYKTIGDIVIVSATVKMNAVTIGANSSYLLIDLPYKCISADDVFCVGISNLGKLFKFAVPKNNTWLQFQSQNKTAYTFADGEQINVICLYKIK